MEIKTSPDVQKIYDVITASAEKTEAAYLLLQDLYVSLFCALYYDGGLYCDLKSGKTKAQAALEWMQENYGRIRNEVNCSRLLAQEAQDALYTLIDEFN